MGCVAVPPLLLIILLFAGSSSAQLQHVQGINHPAAGPDFGQYDLLTRHQLLGPDGRLDDKNEKEPAGLVDPDGRQIIVPLRKHQLEREKQIEEERNEIARIIAEAALAGRPTPTLWTWCWALFGCTLVVLCGVVPAFLLPANSSEFLHTPEGKRKLNLLLSFAVGSLLGDVFLHLLPETWAAAGADMDQIGVYTIAGLLICFLVEKLCATTEDSQHRVCAMMNLAANMVDNFTHGLAVGASFLVGVKFGLLTTFAILIHEIPHEVSDFAILLRADYNRIDAVKAQLVTASGGVLGACAALFMNSESVLGDGCAWILPFTAGGFINIALAQILPELMQENNRRQNFLQLALILSGVGVMAAINSLHAH